MSQSPRPTPATVHIPGPETEVRMGASARRFESRAPVRVAVDLASVDVRMPAQEGFTENVSERGARVVTNKPWQPNERLNVRSLQGSLRARARVVYCQILAGGSFALGLELVTAAGDWTSPRHPPSKVA
jgi:hypothetical protein